MAEVFAEGEAQTVASVLLPAGQAVTNSRLANEASLDAVSHNVPSEQNGMPPLPIANSVTMDSNQQSASATTGFSRVICPTKESACVPLANRPSEGCDTEAGISHPGSSKEGVGDVRTYHSTKASTRRSAKRARTVALDADHHSTAQPRDDDAIVSGDPQSLARDGVQAKSSVSIAQEEEPTVILPVSTFYVSSLLDADSNQTRFAIPCR